MQIYNGIDRDYRDTFRHHFYYSPACPYNTVHVSKATDLCLSDGSTVGAYCAIVSTGFIAYASTRVGSTTIHFDNNSMSIDVTWYRHSHPPLLAESAPRYYK
ncbi:unnamed protein product [Arctia plantaginis]|uniref:Uncharacterized protein n=1 Tax=Arctia plantaginis TaxID=874455 RepID=A0A8S0ZB25_ARCPL|nr:unnamed protein product [Arctia plantaginis]